MTVQQLTKAIVDSIEAFEEANGCMVTGISYEVAKTIKFEGYIIKITDRRITFTLE